MKVQVAIAILFLWTSQICWSMDQNLARMQFKTGEQLLKRNDLEGAYRAYSAALDADPSNAKYASKKSEVGAEVCIRMLDTVRNMAEQDPTSAYTFVQRALSYDPSNAAALHEARILEQQAAAAQGELDEAYTAAYDGDTEKAKALLAAASRFRGWPWRESNAGASFDSVSNELQRLANALQARTLFISGNVQQATELVLAGAPTVDPTSFAGKSLIETRREIIESFLNAAGPKPLDSVTAFAGRARALSKAHKLDPSNKDVANLESETATEYLELLDRLPQQPHFSDFQSASRYHRAVLDDTAEILGFPQVKTVSAVDKSYPALRTNFLISDTESCIGSERDALEAGILQTLSPILSLDKSAVSDLMIAISDVACSTSDIPRSSPHLVNSIYAAGKTQLANPTYVRLQSALSSAEANLNRADAAYQANPSVVNSVIRGGAVGQVRRLSNELAVTPPYLDSEITQPYQYETFQASRSVELKARLAVRSNPITQHSYSVVKDVIVVSEDRQQGISGVLPADRSGATNSTPTLRSIEDLSKQAHDQFMGKLISAAKSAVAGFYAVEASSDEQPDGERLSAMLYLSDLANGTEYEEPAEEARARFRNRLEVDPASMLSLAKTIRFKLPEQTVAQLPVTTSNSTSRRHLYSN